MKTLYIILAVLYALSPYDLVPDFLAGWGWLDDALVIGLLLRFLYVYSRRMQQAGRFREQFRGSANGRQEAAGNRAGSTGPGEKEPGTPGDPHDVLGVRRGASEQEIKKAYRELVNKYHPDKVAHLGEEFRQLAESRFKEIQQAYRELKKS